MVTGKLPIAFLSLLVMAVLLPRAALALTGSEIKLFTGNFPKIARGKELSVLVCHRKKAGALRAILKKGKIVRGASKLRGLRQFSLYQKSCRAGKPRYLGHLSTEDSCDASDFSGDGRVDFLDIVALQKASVVLGKVTAQRKHALRTILSCWLHETTPQSSSSSSSSSVYNISSASSSLSFSPSASSASTPASMSSSANSSSASLQLALSVSQYGITWTFDQEYPVGQFIGGDWWVLGPVIVSSVTPHWDGLKNGSMLDPLPEGDYLPYQGFDARAAGFSADLRIGFPLEIDPQPDSRSLVSMIGLETQNPGGSHEATSDAAVLTVVSSIPPANAFRPPWCGGGGKPIWTVDDIVWANLPSLSLPSGATLPDHAGQVTRPWIDFGPYGQGGSEIHPLNNMPPYPRDMLAAYGKVALACMISTNTNASVWAQKLIQIGIDLYEVSKNNEHGWRAYGGFGQGRKFPIMFAGLLLNQPQMRDLGDPIVPGKGVNTYKFGEDGHSYIGAPTASYPGGAPVFGWNGAENGYSYPNFFANHDIRDPYGVYEPELFYNGEISEIPRMRPEDGWPGSNPGSYRTTNVMAWVYAALAARMLGLKAAWGHDAFFDICDRCRAENWGGNEYKCIYAKDQFVTRMWDTYRNSYP